MIGALAATPDKLPVLLGNPGVGKSSLAQAGVLAALMRQAWPETAEAAGRMAAGFRRQPPLVLSHAQAGHRAGPGAGRAVPLDLAVRRGRSERAERRRTGWSMLIDGKVTPARPARRDRSALTRSCNSPSRRLSSSTSIRARSFTCARRSAQRRRFSEILAHGLGDPRLRAMMSMRADFFGDLQKDEPLYAAHRHDQSAAAARGAIARGREPAGRAALRRFRDRGSCRQHHPAHGRGIGQGRGRACRCCPTCSTTCGRSMVERGDGVLRLPRAVLRAWRRAGRSRQHVSRRPSGRRGCSSAASSP